MTQNSDEHQLAADKRFITLEGDVAHKPLWKSFYKNGDFDVSLYSTAFMLAAQPEPVAMMASCLSASLLYLHNNAVERTVFGSEKKQLFPDSEDLCIDKAPDHNTPRTSAENRIKAHEMHKSLKLTAIFEAAAVTGGVACASVYETEFINYMLSQATDGELAWVTGLTMSLIGNYTKRRMDSLERFKKVLDDEWVIRDLPTLQKEEEALPAIELATVL